MRHNLKYKLLALACAFTLQRMYGATEAKPVSFAVIRTQVVGDNEPQGYKAILPEISVAVQGPKPAVDRLLDQADGGASAVSAVVDLKGLSAGSHSLPVTLSTKRPFEPVPGEPPLANVKLEELTEKPLPVEVVPQGSVPASYRWDSATAAPTIVTVQGPRSAVDQVARLEARVPARQTAAQTDRSVRVQAVDSRDQPMSSVTISPTHVQVRVRIARVLRYKVVPVVLQTTGNPAPGFRLATVQVDPLTVTVSGAAKDVDGIQSISTEPISLEGAAQQPVTGEVKLRLPQGTEVVGVPSVRAKIFLTNDTVTVTEP